MDDREFKLFRPIATGLANQPNIISLGLTALNNRSIINRLTA